MLEEWRHAFELVEAPPVSVRGTIVSSTAVRQRVQEGQVSRACRLLGRWFELEGRIVSGAGRGRSVTVPTLNLEPENEIVPQRGVYLTRIEMDGRSADAITNIGTRPTFGDGEQTIETFVLHGNVSTNSFLARLQFLRRVRDERHFDSPQLLRAQIERDVQAAKTFFRRLQATSNARIHSN